MLCWLILLTCSSRADILTTNIGGWNVTLSSKTNFYLPGEPISVFVTVSNMTQRTGHFVSTIYSDGQDDLAYCALEIRDAKTGIAPKHLLPGDLDADERGGSISPGEALPFKCELTSRYVLTNSGTYAVSFHGKLDTIPELGQPTHSGMPIQFDLSTLYITIGDSSKRQ